MGISVDAIQSLIIPAAMAMDALLGDPRHLPHPIRWMGLFIETCEPRFRRLVKSEYLAGVLFALAMIIGCWSLALLSIHAAYNLHPLVGYFLEVVLIFYSLSARSLRDAAMEILDLLQKGRTAAAREKLSLIVGRDVDRYETADIARASVETVAENFVDGVLSPLFFAVIGGAPLAMVYKMINTLDSMVGYKNRRYRRFGWAAARIDDLANFVPARLSILTIFLASRVLDRGRGRSALLTAINEGANHSSPNAGYPEAAFAGALYVKLNGPNRYGGVLVDKPYIGIDFGSVRMDHIRKACELMVLATGVAVVIAWSAALALRL
ncbi:MAG: adenosylcobinamide-phosphate synthase CbiB [Desulfobacteraceae bacterium]|jgi:adenosylcobinamide-phosphate synthase